MNKYLEKIAATRYEQYVQSKMDVSDPNRDRAVSAMRKDPNRFAATPTTAKEKLDALRKSAPPAQPTTTSGKYSGSRFQMDTPRKSVVPPRAQATNVLERLNSAEKSGKAVAESKARIAARIRFPSEGGVAPSVTGPSPSLPKFKAPQSSPQSRSIIPYTPHEVVGTKAGTASASKIRGAAEAAIKKAPRGSKIIEALIKNKKLAGGAALLAAGAAIGGGIHSHMGKANAEA